MTVNSAASSELKPANKLPTAMKARKHVPIVHRMNLRFMGSTVCKMTGSVARLGQHLRKDGNSLEQPTGGISAQQARKVNPGIPSSSNSHFMWPWDE
jgi:hypothetical protein